MVFNNKNAIIELDDSTASIASLRFSDKEFVCVALPLLSFRLRDGAKVYEFTSNEAESVKLAKKQKGVGIKLSGFGGFDIAFFAVLNASERFEWKLSYKNNTGLCVEWVSFPQIAVPNDLVKTGGSGRILVDNNEGLIVDDMQQKQESHQYYRPCEYPSEGTYAMFPGVVQSQFLAYYDDNAGLYIASCDKDRSVKGINFFSVSENAIKLEFKLYPGADAGVREYAFDFPMVMQMFTGDWHVPAQLYREWFENNLPKGMKKLCDREDIPEWYFDSPLVVTYPTQGIHDMDTPVPNKLFPYTNALPYIDEFSSKTGSRIMALLMHWEGTAPWAPPYVCPPLGGNDAMLEFSHKLHEKNNVLGVYCSGISYTVKSNLNDYNCQQRIENEDLLQYMCAPADGTAPVSKTCQAQRVSYDMCPACGFTKDVMKTEAEKMAALGLDYIQILDQNHGGTPYFCYSDKHGHPPVPGLWLVQHMNKLLDEVKEVVGDKILLGCESASAESFMSSLQLSDNRFNLNFACGYPVPLYAYIYHEYLYNFSGNSVCSEYFLDSDRCPDSFMLRTAHSFIAGDLMTLVINQDGKITWNWGQRDFSSLPDGERILKFIKSATAVRRGAGKDFLVYGKMISPLKSISREIPVYKPETKEATGKFPVVLSSAWQSQQGKKAQFFANYTKENEVCVVDLSKTRGAELISDKGEIIRRFGANEVSFNVPSDSVVMMMFE